MRTKKLFFNIIVTIIYQILHFAFGLIIPRLMISFFGSGLNGAISTSTQFTGYFSYVEAGISSSCLYPLILCMANKDKQKSNNILYYSRKSYYKFGLFYLLAIGAFSFAYAYINKNILNVDLSFLFSLMAVSCLAGFFDFITLAKYRVLLLADQKNYVISFANVISLLLNFAMTLIIIYCGGNIIFAKIPPILCTFLRSAILYIYVKKHYKNIKFKKTDDSTPIIKASNNYYSLFFQIANQVTTILPIMFLMAKPVFASVFSIYNLVFSGLTSVIAIFTTGSSASFGDVIAKNENSTLKTVYNSLETIVSFLIATLLITSVIVIKPFMQLYSNGLDANYYYLPFCIMFVTWSFFQNCKIPFTTLINAKSVYKKTFLPNLIQILILIIFGLLSIFLNSIIYILIGMTMSSLFGLAGYIYVSKKYVFDFDIGKSLRRLISSFILLIFGILVSLFITDSYDINSWMSWIMFSIHITLCFSVITFGIFSLFDSKYLFFTFNKIKSLLSSFIKKIR